MAMGMVIRMVMGMVRGFKCANRHSVDDFSDTDIFLPCCVPGTHRRA